MLSDDFVALSSPRRSALVPRKIAPADGRYHRRGAPVPLYASSTERACVYELLGQFCDRDGDLQVPPSEILSEIKHRVSALRVRDLLAVDLTDERVRARLGVTEAQLVGDDCETCHAIADLLRARPDLFGGILAPSAAVRYEQTLVVFPERIGAHVTVTKALQANASRLERATASVPIVNAIGALVGAGATIAALVRYLF
jgi:hypothetical protein